MVCFDVALIVDLHQHVAVAAVEQPSGGIGDSAAHGGLILYPAVLTKIEIADNRNHPQFVGAREHACQAGRVGRPQITLRIDGRILPRLTLRVPLRASALQVDGKGQDAVPPPFRKGRDELANVAVRIPFPRVRIGPARTGCGIEIVEDGLHCPDVHQQPFDSRIPEPASLVGEFPVDEKLLPLNGDFGPSGLGVGSQCWDGAR